MEETQMDGRTQRGRGARALIATALVCTAAAAAGCGSSNDDDGATTAAASTSPGPTTTATGGGGAEGNAVEIAASVFSDRVCEPKDPAVIADIPRSVAGFTGYDSAPGDWLAEPADSPLSGKRVSWTSMGLGQPFFLAIQDHWKSFSDRYDFELKTFDGKFDASGVQKVVEDIAADKPDAVAFAPLDSDASVPQIRRMVDAGSKVVTYNVQPREQQVPRVFADDYLGSQIVGCNAGAYWNAKFGDRQAVIGVVDLPELPQVQDRRNGFIKGFLSQVPTAEIGASVDGGGTLDKAAPAATDLIQGNPDVNVIFGINNDSSLGTVQALKAAGKYDADWGVLASVDGSAPVMRELGDPNTPYKAEGGYPPYDFAVASFNLLGADMEGRTAARSQVVLVYPPIKPDAAAIREWLDVQYPSN
jgi:ABC-type sugar transport system substrate-binding protein